MQKKNTKNELRIKLKKIEILNNLFLIKDI